MNKTVLIIVIVLLVGIGGYFLLRGGYGGDQAPTSGTVEEKIVSEGTEVKEFTISGTEYSFSPSSITISAGDQVKISFENTGRILHNLIIEELGIGTGTISAGQTDTIEFIAPASGTYTFSCSVPGHAVSGMLGDLIVE